MPNRFFSSLDELQRITLALDHHRDTLAPCAHCSRKDAFVSHGFVYKKQSCGEPVAVGKRLFCANRHGRLGCGRTYRLYLMERIPRLFYYALSVTLFVWALIAGASIAAAYQQATGAREPRHAYRWLAKLWNQMTYYRQWLTGRDVPPGHARSRRLVILLPTLQRLLVGSCAALYQLHTQHPFI
jgi:hypothetical protein